MKVNYTFCKSRESFARQNALNKAILENKIDESDIVSVHYDYIKEHNETLIYITSKESK